MNFPAIYLASGSPRRCELLSQIGVSFERLNLQVDETVLGDETALAYVERVAILKARTGWHNLIRESKEKRPVLGADTSVVIDGEILGKPTDKENARLMLRRLSGVEHQVMTSLAVNYHDRLLSRVNINTVKFAELSDDDINWYLSTGEGDDKAGGYAVQGLAAIFIEQIQGSYSGIMGLPLKETADLLRQVKGE
jgi:septum formation protein